MSDQTSAARSFRFSECLPALLISLAFVFALLAGLGTLTCGWHLVDDHEFAEWYANFFLDGESYATVTARWLAFDFRTRFEPLYYPSRILLVRLFGMNLTLFSVLLAVLTAATMTLLYAVSRSLGFSRWGSALFAALCLTGYQSAAWWKLGPQEIPCSFFFAAGLLAEIHGLQSRKKSLLVLSVCSFFIMSCLKESFIILLPYAGWFALQETLPRHETKNGYRLITLKSFREGWRSDVFSFCAALFVIFCAAVVSILKFVGTNNYSGVGLSLSTPISTYISSYAWAFDHDLKFYVMATLVFGAVLLTFWAALKKNLSVEFFGLLVFLIPQLILFGKEAMSERYILPSAIGYSLFFIVFVERSAILVGKRRLLYRFTAVLLFAAGLRSAVIEADYYRYRGESVTAMLDTAVQASKEGALVCSCLGFSNPEADMTLSQYLRAYSAVENLLYWNEQEYRVQKSDPFYLTPDVPACSLEDVDLVLCYNASDRHYTGDAAPVSDHLLDNAFTAYPCGSVTIYVNNGTAFRPEIPEITMPIYY